MSELTWARLRSTSASDTSRPTASPSTASARSRWPPTPSTSSPSCTTAPASAATSSTPCPARPLPTAPSRCARACSATTSSSPRSRRVLRARPPSGAAVHVRNNGHMSTAPEIAGWNHTYSGQLRDVSAPASGEADRMLVVASDRASAFDPVLGPGIPGKGALLPRLSNWWFEQLSDVPNHLAGEPPAEVAERAMLVRSLDMLPIECVVRGYITGSGWLEYQEAGTVCGIALPEGLRNG